MTEVYRAFVPMVLDMLAKIHPLVGLSPDCLQVVSFLMGKLRRDAHRNWTSENSVYFLKDYNANRQAVAVLSEGRDSKISSGQSELIEFSQPFHERLD